MIYAKSKNGTIHLISGVESDRTLCGDAEEGDPSCEGYTGDDSIAWEPVNHGPVNCPRCAAEILQCRGVRLAKKLLETI